MDNQVDTLAHDLLDQKMQVTLPLGEIFRLRPALWEQIASRLKTLVPGDTNQESKEPKREKECPEICKMSQYVRAEGDKGNTTLKLEVNQVKTEAILDTGAGISIITKQTWKKWGEITLLKTRMGLQLADGVVKYPMGLLEDVTVTIVDYSLIIHLQW